MSEEPLALVANEWATITYYPERTTLQLTWGEKTRSMSDDGFKATLQV
jgi:hypothetical protein